MLAKLGITVEPNPMDFNTLLDSETNGTFTVSLHGLALSNYDVYGSVLAFRSDQIPTAANGMWGQNVTRYSSAEMDTWIDAARTATTASAVMAAYSHIQDIFAEDLPTFYLEQRVYPDEVRKGLLGYDHFCSSTVCCNWNVQDWSWSGRALTVNAIGSGTVSKSPDQSSCDSGTLVTLTATPAAGYAFTGWSGDLTGSTNPTTITMDADKTVTATFTAIPTYTLAPSAGTGGTITPNTMQTVLQGGSTTFTIVPGAGYHIADVSVDGVSHGTISSYTFTNVTSNHTISARFEQEKKQTVIVLQIGNSMFTVNGGSSALDSPPVIKNGRTLVPIRVIIEALGGSAGWDGTARKATVTLGSTTIELWIGRSAATVNGVTTPIDATNAKVVPEIISGRTMLPLRFVTESLGATLGWDQNTQTITITYQPGR